MVFRAGQTYSPFDLPQRSQTTHSKTHLAAKATTKIIADGLAKAMLCPARWPDVAAGQRSALCACLPVGRAGALPRLDFLVLLDQSLSRLFRGQKDVKEKTITVLKVSLEALRVLLLSTLDSTYG